MAVPLLGSIAVRALICTAAIALLLFGTSLFSRDRDHPPWAQRGNEGARRNGEPNKRFETVASLLESLEDVTTGSVETRNVRRLPQDDRPINFEPSRPAPEGGPVAADRVPRSAAPKRYPASPSGKVQPQRRRDAFVPSQEVPQALPRATDQPVSAQPVEYSLADRGN